MTEELETENERKLLKDVAKTVGFIACIGANIYFIRQGLPTLIEHGIEGGLNAHDAVTAAELVGTGLGANFLAEDNELVNVLKGEDSHSEQRGSN
jgi:hypothetical protein